MTILIALALTLVNGGLLNDQWQALMAVYTAAGCPESATTVCPRFDASLPCPPHNLVGNDVRLNCNATHVLHINFATQALDGVVSSQIGKLTGLTRLDIYDNKNLRGTIPDTIRMLSKLTFLAMASNLQMTGTIPDLSTLTDATDIHLWGNRLEGTISPTFAKLPALRVLLLHENELLQGTIPSEFAAPSGMWTDLRLHQNRLSGIVPALPAIATCTVAIYRADRNERNCFANCPLVGQRCNCSFSDSLIRRCASNDECAGRAPAPLDGIVNAAFATASCPLGGCASVSNRSGPIDVWYAWNATCTGRAYVDACAGPAPSAVAVYDDGCPSASNSCDNWAAHSVCSAFASNSVCRLASERAEFDVVAGQAVALRVYALNNLSLFSAKLNISCAPLDCAGELGGSASYDRCGVCRQPSDTSPLSCETSASTTATASDACAAVTCPRIECSDRTLGWFGNACKAFKVGARSATVPCVAGKCDGANSESVAFCSIADLGVLHTCVDAECVRKSECQPGRPSPGSVAALCMADGEECGDGKRCTTDGKCAVVATSGGRVVRGSVALGVVAIMIMNVLSFD